MIQNLTGIDSDFIIIGLAVVCIVLIVLTIVSLVQNNKLKKRLDKFMKGKDARSLEGTINSVLEQIDELVECNATNERNIDALYKRLERTYQKSCLEKYNALSDLGGNMSFALALLDEKNNGFILNVVHTREGSYTYIKEIIDGNSVLALGDEEEKALNGALNA